MSTKCEYCTFDGYSGEPWIDANGNVSALHQMNNYFWIAGNLGSSANITHCPMCGRKLSEE